MNAISMASAAYPHAVPLWERDWLDRYPTGVPSSLRYPSIPVHGLLAETARRYPTQTACTLFETSWSYGRVLEQSVRLASELHRLGASRGRRVALLLPNIPEYLVAINAAWMTGATVLQLSPLMVGEEIQRLLALTECPILVTLDLLAPAAVGAAVGGPLEHVIVTSLAERLAPLKGWLYRFERIRRHGPVRLHGEGRWLVFEQLVRAGSGRFPPPAIAPEQDIALMAPTGGTTGSPKIVMLTHRNLVANALQLKVWSLGRDAADSLLAVLPFFHAYGLSVCMLSGTAMAATLHLHPRFDAAAVLDIIRRRRPTLMPAVPAMLAALNRVLKEHPADLSSIRAVICGAAALAPQVGDEFAAAGARGIVEGYGLTEASPVTHANPIGPGNRPGTIGVPLPDTEARIVDPADPEHELPVGKAGELAVRGPQIMAGYFRNPEETARVLRRGWLLTGDVARKDADGYFTLVDRKKDIIKTSGFLVFPAEVEEVILRFPQVAEAAVIGVPDAVRGEIIKAVVVPRNGAVDCRALERFCAEHLSKHKRPKAFEVVRELPKNFLGKVLRRRLRE